MSTHRGARRSLLFLLVSAVMLSGSMHAEEEKLKISSLGDVRPLFSQADARTWSVREGVVLPRGSLTFGKGQPEMATITIGETKIQVLYKKKMFGAKVNGKGGAIRKKGKLLAPLDFKLESGEDYTLAFPEHTAHSSYGALYYRSGSVQKGRLGTETLSLYDDNTDGTYTTGSDTWQLDNGPLFAPMADTICGKSAYKISGLEANGSTLTYAPYTGETGSLDLAFEGKGSCKPYIAYTNGKTASVILDGGSSCKVPTGRYTMAYGVLLYSGKIAAAIKPGTGKPLEAVSGKTVKAVVGEKIRLNFKVASAGGKLVIDPGTFRVTSESGEEYVGYDLDGRPKIMLVKGKKSAPLGSFGFG